MLITFLASYLIFIMFAGTLVIWISDGKIKKEQIIHAFFAVIIAFLATQAIKVIFPRNRPFLKNGEQPLTLTVPQDSAFPSSHTAIAFSLAVTFFLHSKKLGIVYLVLALLIGLARVVGNVHYPSDIIAGAIVGTVVAYMIEKRHIFTIK